MQQMKNNKSTSIFASASLGFVAGVCLTGCSDAWSTDDVPERPAPRDDAKICDLNVVDIPQGDIEATNWAFANHAGYENVNHYWTYSGRGIAAYHESVENETQNTMQYVDADGIHYSSKLDGCYECILENLPEDISKSDAFSGESTDQEAYQVMLEFCLFHDDDNLYLDRSNYTKAALGTFFTMVLFFGIIGFLLFLCLKYPAEDGAVSTTGVTGAAGAMKNNNKSLNKSSTTSVNNVTITSMNNANRVLTKQLAEEKKLTKQLTQQLAKTQRAQQKQQQQQQAAAAAAAADVAVSGTILSPLPPVASGSTEPVLSSYPVVGGSAVPFVLAQPAPQQPAQQQRSLYPTNLGGPANYSAPTWQV